MLHVSELSAAQVQTRTIRRQNQIYENDGRNEKERRQTKATEDKDKNTEQTHPQKACSACLRHDSPFSPNGPLRAKSPARWPSSAKHLTRWPSGTKSPARWPSPAKSRAPSASAAKSPARWASQAMHLTRWRSRMKSPASWPPARCYSLAKSPPCWPSSLENLMRWPSPVVALTCLLHRSSCSFWFSEDNKKCSETVITCILQKGYTF